MGGGGGGLLRFDPHPLPIQPPQTQHSAVFAAALTDFR